MMLFSILGLQQFSGVPHYRCRLTSKPVNSTYWPKSQIYTRICSPNANSGGSFSCPEGLYCGNPLEYGISLEDDDVQSDPTVDFGINSFDNIGSAILGVFQTFSGERWSVMMYNLMGGYSSFFTQCYFCLIVVIGHFYMLQLLLAVILSNLSKIQQIETFFEIIEKKRIVKKDLKELEKAKKEEEEKKKLEANPLTDLFKEIRRIKEEQKKKEEEEAKAAKPTDQVQGGGGLVVVEKEKNDMGSGFVIGGGRNGKRMQVISIAQDLNANPSLPGNIIQSKPGSSTQITRNPEIDPINNIPSIQPTFNDEILKKKVQRRMTIVDKRINAAKIRESQISSGTHTPTGGKKAVERVSNAMKWKIDRFQDKQGIVISAVQPNQLSKGIAIALLSKVLGVSEIQDKYNHLLEKIKKTKLLNNIDMRLKIQEKMSKEIFRLRNRLDLNVVKMYWKSKKNVYGIENELHLVEQIQGVLKETVQMMNLRRKEKITHFIIEEVFDYEKPDFFKKNDDLEEVLGLNLGPQLDLQMLFTLKVAYNLRDMAYEQNVKDMFFARFKRRLIKKNLVDKMSEKIETYIQDTMLLQRAKLFSVYDLCNQVTISVHFKILSSVMIIGNSLVLGLSYSGMSDAQEKNLEYFNLFFFSFFVCELLIKVTGQGLRFFIRDPYNMFDGIVVFISAIDIALVYSSAFKGQGSGAITALRVFRLVRIFQLAKNWREFQDVMKVVYNTLKDLSLLSILFAVFIFIYMLIGMELYAYKVTKPELQATSESSFDNLLDAFLTVFIVIANDGWSKIYFAHFRSTDPFSTTIYFISLLLIGQMILINLIIAIIIENFEYLSVKNDLISKINKMQEEQTTLATIKQQFERYVLCCKKRSLKSKPKPQIEDPDFDEEEYLEILQMRDLKLQQRDSLNYFEFQNPIRQFMRTVLEFKKFEWFMTTLIVVSSFILALDNPLNDPGSKMSKNISKIDVVLTILFTIEAVFKIISYGMLNCGSQSYLRNTWNILDFFVVLVTLLSYIISAEYSNNLNIIKILRLLKVLRPLRAISRNEGLKLSIKALGVALPEISSVTGLILLFYYVFGVICVNYFSGKFLDCENSMNHQLIDSKWDCLNTGGEWKATYINFDSTIQAMSTLFMMSNTVQWQKIMYRASKLRESQDLSPSDNIQSPYAALFFVFVIIIGNFCMMNLYIGVIITKYNREKELAGKDFMLTEEQKNWVQNRMMILHSQPKLQMRKPHEGWRQAFYYLAKTKSFQWAILCCIILNSLVLALEWYGQPKQMIEILETVNFIFLVIFTTELLTNFLGFGKRFFSDKWNIFDLVIIILSWLGFLISSVTSFQLGPHVTIIKSFRIARILFFFKGNRTLKGTIMTFIVTLPAMVNIGGLLFLIILIYAVLGMYLFATVKLNGALSEDASFLTVGSSFVALIRVLTGEDWPSLMEALSQEDGPTFKCLNNPSYQDYASNNYQPLGCGNELYAKFYFFSFVLIVAIIFMRVFIAIVLQTFQSTTQRESKFLSSDLSEHFRECWSIFDPNATSFIKVSSYSRFLLALGDPLGWDVTFNHNYLKQQEYLVEIFLPRYNKKKELYFMDVFEHLVLIMIIRREVINYALKNGRTELLNIDQDKMYVTDDEQEPIAANMQLDITRTGSGGGEAGNIISTDNDLLGTFPLREESLASAAKLNSTTSSATTLLNASSFSKITQREEQKQEWPIKEIKLSEIPEDIGESEDEESKMSHAQSSGVSHNHDDERGNTLEDPQNMIINSTQAPSSSAQQAQSLQKAEKQYEVRMMRHIHYQEKFFTKVPQNESPTKNMIKEYQKSETNHHQKQGTIRKQQTVFEGQAQKNTKKQVTLAALSEQSSNNDTFTSSSDSESNDDNENLSAYTHNIHRKNKRPTAGSGAINGEKDKFPSVHDDDEVEAEQRLFDADMNLLEEELKRQDQQSRGDQLV